MSLNNSSTPQVHDSRGSYYNFNNNDNNDNDNNDNNTDDTITTPFLQQDNHIINDLPDKPPSFPSLIPHIRWYWLLLLILLITFVILCYTIWEQEIIINFFGLTLCKVTEVGSLPLISIVFTYVHIYAALWMTFYPLNYIGWCQIKGTNVGLGWQGIVPSKAKKMAKMATTLMTEKLFRIEELFAKVDANEIANQLEIPMSIVVRTAVENAAQEAAPQAWNSLEDEVREDLLAIASKDTHSIVYSFFRSIQVNIENCFDVENLVLDAIAKDKDLLNQMFIRCGSKELTFIRNAGAWMGGFFGILQAILYLYYDAKWVLPTAGLIVGCFTNWLALFVIFSPIEPISLCGGRIILQGLFLKRQKAVAAEYGRTVSREILHYRAILNGLLNGPKSSELCSIILQAVDKACEDTLQKSVGLRTLVDYTIGPERFILFKGTVSDAVLLAMPDALQQVEDYINQCLDTETVLREKLGNISSKDFESMLHPVFQEDEWKLVLMGGALGVAIGLVQTFLINTGSC